MKYILILLVTVTLFSCYNKDEYCYGGYYLDSESEFEKFISHDKVPDTIFINDDGVKYNVKAITFESYFRNIKKGLFSNRVGVISPFVFKEETRFDSKFILIVQEPFSQDNVLISSYTYPQYTDTNYKEFSDVKIWYWIINKIDDIIYGPYTKEMYLEKRVEIGVPDSLRLRFEVEKQNQTK